jgi:hypothetical protein
MALTPDENEELRRINVLAQFGELPPTMQARFTELRNRDELLEIPEPTLDVQWMPLQRSRDDALDDLTAELDQDLDDENELEHDDMTTFEIALGDTQSYVVTPAPACFVPSRRYGPQ